MSAAPQSTWGARTSAPIPPAGAIIAQTELRVLSMAGFHLRRDTSRLKISSQDKWTVAKLDRRAGRGRTLRDTRELLPFTAGSPAGVARQLRRLDDAGIVSTEQRRRRLAAVRQVTLPDSNDGYLLLYEVGHACEAGELSWGAGLLYSLIRSHAGNTGKICDRQGTDRTGKKSCTHPLCPGAYPSVGRLGQEMGRGRTQVKQYLRELIARGWLTILHTEGRGVHHFGFLMHPRLAGRFLKKPPAAAATASGAAENLDASLSGSFDVSLSDHKNQCSKNPDSSEVNGDCSTHRASSSVPEERCAPIFSSPAPVLDEKARPVKIHTLSGGESTGQTQAITNARSAEKQDTAAADLADIFRAAGRADLAARAADLIEQYSPEQIDRMVERLAPEKSACGDLTAAELRGELYAMLNAANAAGLDAAERERWYERIDAAERVPDGQRRVFLAEVDAAAGLTTEAPAPKRPGLAPDLLLQKGEKPRPRLELVRGPEAEAAEGELIEKFQQNAAANVGHLPALRECLRHLHRRHAGPHRVGEPDDECVKLFSALAPFEDLAHLARQIHSDAGRGGYGGGVLRPIYFFYTGLERLHRITGGEQMRVHRTLRRALYQSPAARAVHTSK